MSSSTRRRRRSREYQGRRKAYAQRTRDLAKFARLPTVTRDGKALQLMANIEFPEEANVALRSGADGVGLYRTEFLFLNRKDIPTEEEHFETYRKVAEKFVRHPVTIRTFDLGGDKFASQIELADEMQPRDGAAGDPVLPEGKGDLQAPAPCDPARRRRTGRCG